MKRTFALLLVTLVAAGAFAESLIIPAAGTGEGKLDSQWQTELTLHNAGMEPITLTLEFRDVNGLVGSTSIVVLARQTLSLQDVVRTEFGRDAATGALVISGEDLQLRKLAVSSRTFATSPAGEFGQDVPAFRTTHALIPGDTGVVAGPSSPATARFNFGLYAVEEASVEWVLLRADGTEASHVSREYAGGTQVQYVGGVETLFGVQPGGNDVVYARVRSGSLLLYGSIVNNATNDPTFVTFSRTRENFGPELIGLDLNEDGSPDILDLDGDGVLDRAISIATGYGFPAFFRVLVEDPEGSAVILTLGNMQSEASLIGDGRTIQWLPWSSRRGTSSALILHAFDGTDTVEFTIPVNFR